MIKSYFVERFFVKRYYTCQFCMKNTNQEVLMLFLRTPNDFRTCVNEGTMISPARARYNWMLLELVEVVFGHHLQQLASVVGAVARRQVTMWTS